MDKKETFILFMGQNDLNAIVKWLEEVQQLAIKCEMNEYNKGYYNGIETAIARLKGRGPVYYDWTNIPIYLQ